MGKRYRRRRKWCGDKEHLAMRLRASMPASEEWFWHEWDRIGMRDPLDKSNQILFGFIPDLVNLKYRYVIEVNGSIHSKPFIKRRDKLKAEALSRAGFSVFMLRAYDDEQLRLLADEIDRLRNKPIATNLRPKTILRPANC